MPIDNVFEITLLFSLAFYGASLLGLLIGVSRLEYSSLSEQPFVSIIVSARNEERNISRLLQCLLSQEYPSYEVIIVDDRSSDKTSQIVRSSQTIHHNLRLIEIREVLVDLPSKKNALSHGILASKGDILCFTDADCTPPKSWVRSLVSLFDKNVGLVAGYSPYDETLLADPPGGSLIRFLVRFVAYEELKGAISSAGAIGLNKGWLCTGRNLAYRKSVWEEVGGFHDIRHSIGGDDDLFLQTVRKKTDYSIRYALAADSHVSTAPPTEFSAFLEQRKRHFSAGKYFPFSMKAFFLLFHSSNLVLFLGLVAGLVWTNSFADGIWFFLGKLALDFLLVFKGARLLSTTIPISFPLMEFLYILYNTFVGPLGFIRSFEWKPDLKS